jgi:formylglycine-generating enzyme required for sulfatase activity
VRHLVLALGLLAALLAACAAVDLSAPIPTYETGVDPNAWAQVPAGEFLAGQYNDPLPIDYDYEVMVTDVTVAQYVEFLNAALADRTARIGEQAALGAYPGDTYAGARHETRIDPGDYLLVPLDDPASRFTFDGQAFAVKSGWENHPVTNVSWFGARAYCSAYGWRLPTGMEWEKAARGTDGRPYPWGDELSRNHANYYNSGDPFEEMSTAGSRTTPVGFYDGQAYEGYVTHDAASPYGLYDMAGNVWQWVGDVHPGFSDRFLRGGSKDSYPKDLRAWVRNSAPPMYYGPGVGFRCARLP